MKQCEETKMVSESKVRVISSPFQTLLTKADIQVDAWRGVRVWFVESAMHADIQFLCGGEKTKGNLPHLKILSAGRTGADHLRLLSQQHLWASGVRF